MYKMIKLILVQLLFATVSLYSSDLSILQGYGPSHSLKDRPLDVSDKFINFAHFNSSSFADGLDVLDQSINESVGNESVGSPSPVESQPVAVLSASPIDLGIQFLASKVTCGRVMKKPSKQEIDVIFNKLFQPDTSSSDDRTEFANARRASFQNLNTISYENLTIDDIDDYLQKINNISNKFVKKLIEQKKLNFDVEQAYVLWVAKKVAIKIVSLDVQNLIKRYLFEKIRCHKDMLNEEFLFQELINILGSSKYKFNPILTKLAYISEDPQYQDTCSNDIALSMIKTILPFTNQPKDQALVLQEYIRIEQLRFRHDVKMEMERRMHEREQKIKQNQEALQFQVNQQL
ncbi:hypothetical protein KAZ82_00410 [Candidatus Babeliales bacterium]|nr:hypothetical protein [Candidatus Babeliales bacterium]